MAEFGDFAGFESKVYRFSVDGDAVPVALSIATTGARDRDFIVVPDDSTAQAYSATFASWSHSAQLGRVFRYLDGDHCEVLLRGAGSGSLRGAGEIRFAIVRWARASEAPFPTVVHCLQQVTLGDHTLTQIVPAAVAAAESEGAQR